MTLRGLAALALLGAAALLADGGRLVAHDVADLEFVPKLDRFALAAAYRRGGEVERANLEASMLPIPGADEGAVQLIRDLDGDGDPDEVHFHLEVVEIQEEVYPGEFVTFWVFAPRGTAMTTPARLPSPTLRVEQGDVVEVTLYNTHYLPHTIHFHGTSQPNNMDGVPHMTQDAVAPGDAFTYTFVAGQPGTYWYHCHVQEQIHPSMGLAGMFVIEADRPFNHFAHLIPGAGRITSMAKATREEYQNEYSLVYMDIDDRLHRIPAAFTDPREVEKRMHRDYDVTRRASNIFLLNGRSFPFTLRDSPVVVRPDQTTKLRVLNVGPRSVYLHTHGHHPTLTHLDGYPVPPAARITRDTFEVGPAQRIDLALRTGSDGVHAAGPGVWLVHDHAQPAATNKGINPGGDHTAIVYEEFMGDDGLPRTPGGHAGHQPYFDPNYYRGRVPVFDPNIFGTTVESYEKGWPVTPPAGGAFSYPVREEPAALPRLDLIDTERHRPLASACPERPRATRRIVVKAGRQYARAGEVFAFEPRDLRVGRCEEVEIVLENTDGVRHDLMIPGLNPIFALNVSGPATAAARFVTPDEDVTLFLHCHIAAHDKVGMTGSLVVGKGGEPKASAQTRARPPDGKVFHGVGVVIGATPRSGRLIVNHEAIPGFMAAMEMSFAVTPPSLLNGVRTGDRIQFTIDAAGSVITSIAVTQSAP
jgi:FtsP/CotA-like multicopper oxidase with cupredoxin domain/Cu/Ag efflux protein CusF